MATGGYSAQRKMFNLIDELRNDMLMFQDPKHQKYLVICHQGTFVQLTRKLTPGNAANAIYITGYCHDMYMDINKKLYIFIDA